MEKTMTLSVFLLRAALRREGKLPSLRQPL
jgi:hypothetical protein